MFKKLFILILLIASAGGYYYWQGQNKITVEQKYKFHTIEKGDIIQSVAANGTLNPLVLVTVGTQVSGKVIKLYADFNDRVEKGQVLAELDPAILNAQVAASAASVKSAKASLELAEANEKRAKALFDKEYISKQEFDATIQALKSSRASLDLALAQHQKDLTNQGYTIIRSPVSGVVIDRQIDVGQTVAASLQAPVLFKIAQDLRQMQIDSNFAEADIGRIKVGQSVNFSVDAFPNMSFSGTVKQVRLNAMSVSNVVTYDVVVSVENPKELLVPGMTAYVNVILAQKQGVLMVPNMALRFKPSDENEKDKTGNKSQKKEKKASNESTIYLLENDALKPIKVKLGINDSRFTEIVTDELKEGDKIVVEEIVKAAPRKRSPMGMF